MPPKAAIMPRLLQIAQSAAAAPQGAKGAIYAAACAELGCSLPTLHRWMHDVRVAPRRKERLDAGTSALPRVEAETLSAFLQESHRKNGKRLMSLGDALDILRANGELRAEAIDAATGEVTRLSASACARALRAYGLHPDQLNRPAPAVELASLHPNHVWQIDASLCVLYYLHEGRGRDSGLQVMERERFYKNKPRNLARITADRVWSYEWTDHFSGAIGVHYVMGAESGANLAESFICAMHRRPDEPFHGVPRILMMDPGSANTSGLFKNLARALGVELIAHAPGSARATGQVEKARDIIERGFESGLRFKPVAGLEELNAQAGRWAAWFNASRAHTRHGKTRTDCWMTIAAAQLREPPAVEVCQKLLVHTPEPRKVSVTLTVQFDGREFDVAAIPGVQVGEKLQVTYGVAQQDGCTVIVRDADGHERYENAPMVERVGEGNFRADANVIGEDWARPADTQADRNRKAMKRLAYGAATNDEAEAAQKARTAPFGGRIDPAKRIDQAPARTWLPRRGEQVTPSVRVGEVAAAAPRALTFFEASKALTDAGLPMDAERLRQMRAWYPAGVPEPELPALQQRLSVRATLRVIGSDAKAN